MEVEIASSPHNNETDTIEDILQRLSVNSRQNSCFVENCRDGKLIVQIDLFDLMVDSTDTTNKLYSSADIWCHIKFGGEVQKIALKAFFAQRGCPVIFDVHEFYGPDIVEMKLVQMLGLFSEEVADISIRMKDVLRGQEARLVQLHNKGAFENSDRLDDFWGYEKKLNINYMKIGVKMRYSRLQNCLIDHIKLFSRPFVEHAIIARGCTELHHIASLGNSDIMEQVLDSLARKGALKIALKMRSRSGMSVLEAALYSNNYGVVKTLLQRAGIWSFQGTQTSKKTAIHVAVCSQGSHAEDLLKAGQQLKVSDFISTPVEIVSDHVLGYDQGTRCLRAVLRFLSRYNNIVDGWGDNPSIMEMIEWRDQEGYTALMLACATGNASMIKLLLQYGADCGKIATEQKVSPLILATKSGSLDAVKAIFSDRSQSTIFDAFVTSTPSSNGPKVSLASLKCNPCHYDSSGNTALSIAAERGLVDIFEYYLSVGIPYRITDIAGNSPLHLASKMGHVEICQLILDAERDLVIKEIETELGSAECMRKELERASSSFRGGLKSGCKSKVDFDKESVFSTMISRRAWLYAKNYRGLCAADVAKREGNVVVATLIENISKELYSRDFIELQVCHILEGTQGGFGEEKSIFRSLSSLNSQIGLVRSLDIAHMRSTSRGNDIYDDDSFSAAYSFALVTEGTLLGEYEDGRTNLVDTSTSAAESRSSTWNDSQTTSLKDIESSMGMNARECNGSEKNRLDVMQVPSALLSSSKPLSGEFAPSSSLPTPIDISTLPEYKSKSRGRKASIEEQKNYSKEISERMSSSSRPLRTKNGKIIDKDLALSLGISEEEYAEMLTSSSVNEKVGLGFNFSEDRIELKRTSSLKNFTDQIISLKRSISDSKIKF